MKRWCAMLLFGLMLLGTACAQTYTFSDPEHSRTMYTCEDFARDIPSSAKEAFANVLREGTLVHEIMENDGDLHVIVPRGELTWQTDWDGIYGFVKAADVTLGITKADAQNKTE